MFPRLTSTPYFGVDENEFFSKITGNSIDNDVTFLSTMRALLYDRMGEEDTVRFSFHYSTYNKSTISDGVHSTETLINAVSIGSSEPGVLHFHNVKNGSDEDDSAWMDLIRENFTEVNEGFERVEKVHTFFEKHMDVECFINKETRTCYTYGKNMNIRLIHYFEVGIPVFLPWYFTGGMKPEEMELVEGLKKRSSESYLESLGKLIQKYNIEESRMRRLLKGVERAAEEDKLSRVKRDIDHSMEIFRNLQNQIKENLKARKDLEIRKAGLLSVMSDKEESSEILEYFLANKNIHLCDVEDSRITFVVTGNVEYFDEDMVESVLENKRSFVYYKSEYADEGISSEDMGLLIRKIFLDREIKLRFYAGYCLDITSDVQTRRLDNILTDSARAQKYGTYMPNPHIERYSCMGDYQYVVNECLSDGDYITALEQCVASTISLNFADITVMEFFMEKFYRRNNRSYNIKCLELPDGNIVTPKEAIEWLHKDDEPKDVVIDEETGEVLEERSADVDE